jgi:UDP-N-acetylmuramoyl-tripeptide--D-alanyl-D-alanine ligase
MMEPFPLSWAAEKLGVQQIGDDATITGVAIDTRKIEPGMLFFALPGEQVDGHKFVAQAFARGAAAAVVSHEAEGVTGPLMLVPDTVQALGDLAMHYRRQFSIPVVGITGSVGKTSTKEMTAAVLRTRYNTLASEKNYNTEIGVPLTLFRLDRTHEVAVIEMGMRGLGQIDRLAEIAEPTIGVITNIGISHMELLGSRENIALAKSELLVRLPVEGIAILPADDSFFDVLRLRVPAGVRILTFGTVSNSSPGEARLTVSGSHVTLDQGRISHALVRTGKDRAILKLKAAGGHHLHNALAALAVADVLGIAVDHAATALRDWEGAEGRMMWRQTPDNIAILDDCYNASPESMIAALDTLAELPSQYRRIAILGDMKELGDLTATAHLQVASTLLHPSPDVIVTVGPLSKQIDDYLLKFQTEASPEMHHFNDTEAAAGAVKQIVRPGDLVLVKGSRAMQMEKIVAALTGETKAGAHD